MNEHRSYWPGDDAPKTAADEYFYGLEQRGEGRNAAPGWLYEAENCRVVHGRVRPRGGIRAVRWLAGDGTQRFIGDLRTERVLGACRFADPNGLTWLIVAAQTSAGPKVWRTRPNNAAVEIGLNSHALPAEEVEFTQCFNVLVLWRGLELPPLVLRNFDEGFIDPPQSASGTGTQTIPNSDGSAAFFQNRLIVPFRYGQTKDMVAVGDPGDYTRYAYPVAAFRINEGESEGIVLVAPFGKQSVVVFKDSSVYVFGGLVPDQYGNYPGAWADTVTRLHGLRSRHGVAAVGRELYHFDENGLFSLALTQQNELQGTDLPLSAPIERYWGRINWLWAHRAQVAWHANRLYVAVPWEEAKLLGRDVVPEGAQYAGVPGSEVWSTNLAAGRWRIECGENEGYVEVGLDSYPPGTIELEFGATTTVTFHAAGPESPWVTAAIYPVYRTGVNNAVLVFDFEAKAWVSVDTMEGLGVVRLLTLPVNGRERLVGVMEDGTIGLFEEGEEDEVVAAGQPNLTVSLEPISQRIVTRQLAAEDADRKRHRRLTLRMKTRNPCYTVKLRTEGAFEEVALVEGRTFDATRYTAGGLAAYETDNNNDDFATPYREDYTVTLGSGDLNLGSGLALDVEQSVEDRLRVPDTRGAAAQVEVVNTRGALVLEGLKLDAVDGERDYGLKW